MRIERAQREQIADRADLHVDHEQERYQRQTRVGPGCRQGPPIAPLTISAKPPGRMEIMKALKNPLMIQARQCFAICVALHAALPQQHRAEMPRTHRAVRPSLGRATGHRGRKGRPAARLRAVSTSIANRYSCQSSTSGTPQYSAANIAQVAHRPISLVVVTLRVSASGRRSVPVDAGRWAAMNLVHQHRPRRHRSSRKQTAPPAQRKGRTGARVPASIPSKLGDPIEITAEHDPCNQAEQGPARPTPAETSLTGAAAAATLAGVAVSASIGS